MIVIVGPAYPHRGGIADTNHAFARSLIKQGEEVLIISFTTLYPKALFPGKTQYSEDPAPNDLHIIRKLNTLNPISWWRVIRLINAYKPRIVFIRYWTPWLALCLMTVAKGIQRNITKIGFIDNIQPHEQHKMDAFLTEKFTRPFHGFVCLSEQVKNELKKLNSNPSIVLKHPVDNALPPSITKEKARELLGIDLPSKCLLFFGLIRPYKGVDWLLQSLPVVIKRYPNLQLCIVGEAYETMTPYMRLCSKLNITHNVSFSNRYIPTDEIPLWFSACDWVVQPYKSASQSGVTPLALHYKRPVIVTNVGGLPESLGERIIEITEPNPKALAQGILNALHRHVGEEDFKLELKKRNWKNFTKELLYFAQSL